MIGAGTHSIGRKCAFDITRIADTSSYGNRFGASTASPRFMRPPATSASG